MTALTDQPAAGDEHPVQQEELPFAVVQGQPLTQIPKDLYIPPDALEVILEAFEGPLDLLLYLIRRQNLDILDIPIAEITQQYMDYIGLLHELQFELAAEYLVMAAILAEIKSRMLLPRPTGDDEDEEDPRAELVRRLQEYERFKQAAEDLDDLPRQERDFALANAFVPDRKVVQVPPDVDLGEMLRALRDVLGRAELFSSHQVQLGPAPGDRRRTLPARGIPLCHRGHGCRPGRVQEDFRSLAPGGSPGLDRWVVVPPSECASPQRHPPYPLQRRRRARR
ncbi:MAG: segregation/condensation protein A [Xanthomonadales bacterium]